MKRLISITVSLAILSIVWAMLDRGAIWAALKQTDPGLLALSLLSLGDLLKAASMADAGAGELPAALSLGAREKLMDLVMLFVVAAIASSFLGGAPVLTAFLALAGGAGLAVALVPGAWAHAR